MSIITNFMGDAGDKKKRTSTYATPKFCGICQEAFQQGKDDPRPPHCSDCISSNRIYNADFWRNEFMTKKANTLSPEMEVLAQKLSDQKERKSLLEGRNATARSNESNSIRTSKEIKNKNAELGATFELVRAQVMEHLPLIIAELGLTDKIDIELVADMIVPAKINKPIQDALVARAALRSIVQEDLNKFFDVGPMLRSEATVAAKNKKPVQASNTYLSDGIQRVNGTGYSRQVRVANPESVYAPAAPVGIDPQQQQVDPMADAMNAPIGEMDGVNEHGLGPAAEDSRAMSPEPEIVGAVSRIPDELGGQSELDGNTLDMAMPDMNGGIAPIGDAMEQPEISGPPMDGMMKRVQQATAPRVRVVKAQSAPKKPVDMSLFHMAGRVAKNVPVQPIKLDATAKLKLENSPIANYIQAQYADGTTRTWNYYKVDKGGIFTSANGAEFYAEKPSNFAEFIQTDASFVKFAFLPEELQTMDEAPTTDLGALSLPDEAASMASMPGDENGSLSLMEIEPTVLNPAGENAGMMNDQDSIFNNQEAHPAGEDNFNLDMLADEAATALPFAQQSLPDASEEDHMNVALAYAADILSAMHKVAEGLAPHQWDQNNESYDGYLGRIRNQFPGAMQRYKQWMLGGERGKNTGDLESWLAENYGPKSGPELPEDADQIAKHIREQAPEVSSGMAAIEKAPTGQDVQVPLDKQRIEKVKNLQHNIATNPAALPSIQPKREEWESASSSEPEGLAPIPNKELESPEYDQPASGLKYFPGNAGRDRTKPKEMPEIQNVASLEIREIMAGMSEDEFFSMGLPALVAAGYSDDEIMIAVADGNDTVFSDYSAVMNVATPGTADEDAKRGLHNATDKDVLSEALTEMDAKTV